VRSRCVPKAVAPATVDFTFSEKIAMREYRGKGEADHVADVVRNHVSPIDPQRVEHYGNIACLRFLVESVRRLGREPEAAKIRDDHR
jgi:hypothetical protein